MAVLAIFLVALVTAYIQHELALGLWVWIAWTLCALWAGFSSLSYLLWRGRMRQEMQAVLTVLVDMRAMMAGSALPPIIRDPLPGDPLREKK